MSARWLLAVGLLLVALWAVRSALPPFVIAAVLAYAFTPLVNGLRTRARAPRLAAVVTVYIGLVLLLAGSIWVVETQVARQLRQLGQAWPEMVDSAFVQALGTDQVTFMGATLDPHRLAAQTRDAVAEALGRPSDTLRVAEAAVDGLLKTMLTLVALFYLLLDGAKLQAYLLHFVPSVSRPRFEEVLARSHVVLSHYLRGQILLVLIMSIATALMLAFGFRLPYAIPLAVMTGVFEVVPLLGPVVATAVAAMVAVFHGGLGVAAAVVVGYTVLRQIEDQLVMPVVVGRAVELHPLATMFAVVAGGAVAGVLGIILAVPAAAVLKVALDVWIEERE